MDREILVAIISSAGTLIVGLVILAVTNYFSNKRILIQSKVASEKEKRKLLLSKLEELYELFSKWKNLHDVQYLIWSRVIDDEITYNEALDMVTQEMKRRDVNFHRIFLLSSLYFPESRKLLDDFITSRDAMNRIVEDFKTRYKELRMSDYSHHDELEKWSKIFDSSAAAYLVSLADRVKTIL